MEDIVKAAVRRAMAREAEIAQEVEPRNATPPQDDAPSARKKGPRRRMSDLHPIQSKGDDGNASPVGRPSTGCKKHELAGESSKFKRRKRADWQDQVSDSSVSPNSETGMLSATDTECGSVEKYGDKSAVRQGSRDLKPGKMLSSNWNALRKTLGKTGGKSRQRTRPRPKPAAAIAPEETPSTLNVSAFFKRALRSSSVKPTRVLALDCEFVGVGPEGKTDALARASLINSRGEVLFDSFVRIEEPVVDYRTRWSGVRPEDVNSENAADPREARALIAELLKGRILVGHAVQNDLRVLRIQHPRRDIRDTSTYYKKLWRREGRRGGAPPALRLVVAKVLGVDQFQRKEHDSCEDARAALALYKRNAKEWESGKGV